MNEIKIQLADPRWKKETQHGVHLRGTAFSGDVICRRPEDVTAWLPKSEKGVQTWSDAVNKLNGFFALVCQTEGYVVAAVDRLRSIPLFYGQRDDGVVISDDAEWVRQEVGDQTMNPVARDEFQLTGYVTGKETLYSNVKQLQAGELIIVDRTAVSAAVMVHRYFRFVHFEPDVGDEEVWRQGLDDHAVASVKRLIEYADGRQIVIPLSGGYDSRLVATLLVKLGYTKLLTFSYGIKGNKEAAYSQQVAQALGIAWHFVEYSNERWRDAWNTEQRREYQRWASGWTSLPHVQDWVAVRTLQAEGVIETNCVFSPGHTCCRRNTGIPDGADANFVVNIDKLIEKIFQRHYSRSVGKTGPKAILGFWKERIIALTEVKNVLSKAEFASEFERWEWQERQAKFICNSVRVYEFFGCDWWLPLWDSELVKFSQRVPLRLRQGRRWYNDYIKQLYASQIGVDIEQSLNNAEDVSFVGKYIRSITMKFPVNVRDLLKTLRYRFLQKQRTNAYVISHLSLLEIRRLQKEGYRVDGMLVYEFLRSYK
jgi:asparagine synthase (glutamine-hydrolysing)